MLFKMNKKRRNILRETFGTGKFKGSTETLLKKSDKELYSKKP